MTTSAEQIDFDVHLPDDQASNGRDRSAGAPASDLLAGESRTGQPTSPVMALLLSPNLRAALAIGFFLAYLATALT